MTENLFPCHPKFDGATLNTLATLYASVAAVGCFFLLVLVAYILVKYYEGIIP
jgi:hypothetical protein